MIARLFESDTDKTLVFSAARARIFIVVALVAYDQRWLKSPFSAMVL